jgi:hypothetical protein
MYILCAVINDMYDQNSGSIKQHCSVRVFLQGLEAVVLYNLWSL